MMKKHWKLISAISVMLLFAAGVAGWSVWHHARPEIPGYLKRMGGDFTLMSADGPVSLHDYRGRVVLVYFGYTHCPDVCPMALGVIASAIHALKGSEASHAAGIFVSVDPRRDHPDLLKKYTAFFDPHIVGVTGSNTVLNQVAQNWHVSFSVPKAAADENYTVEHSTFIYLVNAKGQIVELFDEKTSPKLIAQAMRRWLD